MRHERNRAQRAVKLVDGVFRQNHFESICMSKAAGSQSTRHDVNDLDADEELLTLGDAGSDRWRTRLIFDDRKISFLLDCGATVNLIAASLIQAMGRMKDVRPTTAKLRMFDSSQLQTSGVITLTVNHPHTARLYDLDFYVATKNDQPLLNFKACSALDL